MLSVSTGLSGLTINCENTEVPNPSCCTSPNVMCPDCASKVLTRNVSGGDDDELEILGEGEDEQPLERPSWSRAADDADEDEPVANADEFLSIPGNPWK